jgi:hypothetical protein
MMRGLTGRIAALRRKLALTAYAKYCRRIEPAGMNGRRPAPGSKQTVNGQHMGQRKNDQEVP